MRRFTHDLIAALLTFTVGVVVATLSRSILPRVHFIQSATQRGTEPMKDAPCNEWESTDPLSNGLAWDLTYMSLLTNRGVCPGDGYCQFAALKPQPPVHKHFAEWQGDQIVSSILIEVPDGHADMAAVWLIRTKDQAYWWSFHPHYPNPLGRQPLPAQDYDRAFETMTCWREDVPPTRSFFNDRGYIGFLSLYKQGRSRQMLLSYKDLVESWDKENQKPEEAAWGRLWKTLYPIYSSIDNQHKNGAQVSK